MEDFSKYNGEGTTLRKAQLRMLDILIEVDKICKKYNIQYWLDFGTLLGAVRHGGFIPWDDDLDITVMRKDYKRLCEVLKMELPDNLVFQNASTEKYYPQMFAKVRDKNSFLVTDPVWSDRMEENGLFIDIFPMEKGKCKIKKSIDLAYYGFYKRKQKILKTNVFMFAFSFVMFYLLHGVVGLLRCFFKIIPCNTFIHAYGINFQQFQVDQKDIFPLKTILFEGIEFPIVSNSDIYLKNIYGNYMGYLHLNSEENMEQKYFFMINKK